MASVIEETLQEALEQISVNYKLLESPSYDLLPLSVLDYHEATGELESIGSYYDLFQGTPQPIDTRTLFELSYKLTETKNWSVSVTVSFLDKLLKTTKLGQAKIQGSFSDASSFTINLSKVLGIAPPSRKVKEYHKNKKLNSNSILCKRILDNQHQCGYFVSQVLKLYEVSISGKTERGANVTIDTKILSDLFKGLFPKKSSSETNEGNDSEENANKDDKSEELLSLNGTFTYSFVKENTELKMKFPEGLVVGIIADYFRIFNEQVTFELDPYNRGRLIALLEQGIINSDEPTPVILT